MNVLIQTRLKILAIVFLVLLPACSNFQSAPEAFVYDCAFNYFDYDADAPHIETQRLSDVFVWIKRRVKGELRFSPGKKLAEDIERKHFKKIRYVDSSWVDRKIWVIPASATKNNNPMSVVIDKRGDTYFIIRINEEHVPMLRHQKGVTLVNGGVCNVEEHPWLISSGSSLSDGQASEPAEPEQS